MNPDIQDLFDQIDQFAASTDNSLTLNYLPVATREAVYEYVEQKWPALFTRSEHSATAKNTKSMIIRRKNGPIDEIAEQELEFFCKYSNVPMPVPRQQYLMRTLTITNPYYDSLNKWRMYQQYRAKFSSFHQMKQTFLTVRKSVVTWLNEQAKKASLCAVKQNDSLLKKISTELYHPNNHNRWFVSIDVRTANFTILRANRPEIVKDASSWNEFISTFTQEQWIIQSKPLREIIFGESNLGKKLSSLYLPFVSRAYNLVLQEAMIYEDRKESQPVSERMHLFRVSNDEIIWQVSDTFDISSLQYIHDTYPNCYHVKMFRLIQVQQQDVFVKEYTDGSREFKKVMNKHVLQAIKQYEDKAIEQDDLRFVDSGIVATYERSIFV